MLMYMDTRIESFSKLFSDQLRKTTRLNMNRKTEDRIITIGSFSIIDRRKNP